MFLTKPKKKGERKKRSPLKDKPLRVPGQSLDEEIQELFEDKVYPFLAISIVYAVFAAYEWWRWYSKDTFHPIAVSLWALVLVGFTVVRVRKIKRRVAALRLGRDGERAVGQYLELLREKGYRVFHDIVGDKFNLDHVICSPHGIFTIETKTFSKPANRDARIVFDGSRIRVGGREPDRNPLVQVQAGAKWLQGILKESTGKSYSVRPVVVFPGWFVEATEEGKKSNVWVLEPKALPTFIENQPQRLAQEDMMLASYHLSRFVRASSR